VTGKSVKVFAGAGLILLAIAVGAGLIVPTSGKSLGEDLVVSTPLIVEGEYGWLNDTTLVGRRGISKTECTSSEPDKGSCYQYFLWELGARTERPLFPPHSELSMTLQKMHGAICISEGKLILYRAPEKLADGRLKSIYDIFDPAGTYQREEVIPDKTVPFPRGYTSPIYDNCRQVTDARMENVYWLPMARGNIGFNIIDVTQGKATFAYLYDANGQPGPKIFDEPLLIDRNCVGYGSSKHFDGSIVLTGCTPQRKLPRSTIADPPECQPMHVLRSNGTIERYGCMPKAPDVLGSWSRFVLTRIGAFGFRGDGPAAQAPLYLLKPGESRLTEILTDRVERVRISPNGCWLAYQQLILGQPITIEPAHAVKIMRLC
jgi:hypothetical protein